MIRKAVLLIGSPKGSHSTSSILGSYLMEKIKAGITETKNLIIKSSLISENGIRDLLSEVDSADIIILASPLYVDSLPFPVVKAMELIADHRKRTGGDSNPRLLAIVNCGFPEARHNDVALAICRRFAQSAGMGWAGGLALEGGQAIDGQRLDRRGGLVGNIKKSLDLAANALLEGRETPEEAVRLMARPLISSWMYMLIGEFGWRRQARRNGASGKLRARPYASTGASVCHSADRSH
jgi:hypothetical protein